MMGKKKLSEIKAQLEAGSALPPGKPPKTAADPVRIVETLEALCTALETEVNKRREPKARRRAAKP
jgi:hypothetical protein